MFVTFTDVNLEDDIERMQSKWNVEKAALQATPTVPEIEKKQDVSRPSHMAYSLYPWGKGLVVDLSYNLWYLPMYHMTPTGILFHHVNMPHWCDDIRFQMDGESALRPPIISSHNISDECTCTCKTSPYVLLVYFDINRGTASRRRPSSTLCSTPCTTPSPHWHQPMQCRCTMVSTSHHRHQPTPIRWCTKTRWYNQLRHLLCTRKRRSHHTSVCLPSSAACFSDSDSWSDFWQVSTHVLRVSKLSILCSIQSILIQVSSLIIM